MKKINIYTWPVICGLLSVICGLFSACEPKALTAEDVFADPSDVDAIIKQKYNDTDYKIYTLNEFKDLMTKDGNYKNDSTPYRTRSKTACGWELFSIDTLPSQGKGIYIRGRITTDDFGGNFYKAMVIQQVVNGEQQNLRLSVDLGSSGGMYQIGQEILIRCNGLAIGRYANQPQLCVPSYNNNIFANTAAEKVGWAAGRINGSVFNKATTLLGLPDQSKLQYDSVELKDLFLKGNDSEDWYRKAGRLDGRLVVAKNVHFTGQYESNGTFADLTTGDPEDDTNANVFAPTTTNIGYPQSRVIANANNSVRFLVANSEYSKFARFYIPGANNNGVTLCQYYEGTVTGILGWYLDNARYSTNSYQDGYEWSITPRGIKNFGMDDIKMFNTMEEDEDGNPYPWYPEEYKAPATTSAE